MTHRCQQRDFLLRFGIDRRQYQRRLLQASRRFWRVRLLNYVITSNHVHLLLWAPRMSDLSAMMHWLQGTFARDYNLRKRREGAFWRVRFHPTLVQSGSHLSRCLFYLDMNMVRAGVVPHPFAWAHGGALELAGRRQRNRLLDRERLLRCLGMPGREEEFRRWYEGTLENLCRSWDDNLPRQRFWSSAFAVGTPEWLNTIVGGKTDLTRYIQPVSDDAEAEDTHVLRVPQSVFLRLWKSLTREKS